MKGNPYRPSNGTEGDWFDHEYCNQCIRMNPNPELKPVCEIYMNVLCYNTTDPEYPKEWIYNENNHPTCTAWVKWDWGNDGDPNDPDNPKAPVPEDPNQLVLPFLLNEITGEIAKERSLAAKTIA